MTTERNAQGVDALAVLERGIADLMEGRATMWTARDVTAMRAAVAELIAADRLLDKTQAAYDRASAGRMRNDLWADVLAARQRRAAALAKFPEPRP